MGARILIVEDDAPIREMVDGLLSDAGFEVVTAANGLSALQLLQPDDRFDLVLLDMGLPMLDGWAFARRMREAGIDVPILVMTAGRDARRAAEEIGAIGYIGKPFDIEDLERSVRAALTNSGEPPTVRTALRPAGASERAARGRFLASFTWSC